MSTFLKLNIQDLARGAVVAVLTAVVGYLGTVTTLLALDWKQLLNIALLAFVGYLAKNLFSTEDGKFGGVV